MKMSMGKRFGNFKKRFRTALYSVAAAVIGFSVSAICLDKCFAENKEIQSADALTSTTYCYTTGDIINSGGTVQNVKLQLLIDAICGGGTDKSITDVRNLVNATSINVEGTMKPSTAGVKNCEEIAGRVSGTDLNTARYGIVVGFGGTNYLLVYLTRLTSGAYNGDVVATFLRADNAGGEGTFIDKVSGKYPTNSNVYDSSKLRNRAKNYKVITNMDALSTYIVTPSEISWQTTGSYSAYTSGVKYTNDYHGGNASWKSDPVWVPSYGEMVNTSTQTKAPSNNVDRSGLWQLNTPQRATSGPIWTRSAVNSTTTNTANQNVQTVGKNGYGYTSKAAASTGMYDRYAFHLNLSAMCVKNVTAPQDVSRDYSGSAINYTNAPWYLASSTYYNDPSYITSTISPAGVTFATMKNAGEYKVTFSLADRDGLVWSDSKTTGVLVGAHAAVTFKINAIPLRIDSFTYNENTKEVTGITSTGAISGESPPYSAFRYKYKAEDGGDIADPYNKPSKSGKYLVVPELKPDSLLTSEQRAFFNNYEVSIGSSAKSMITISGVSAPLPTSREYTGSSVVITDALWYSSSRAYYENPSLMTISPALSTLKDAGTYSVTFTLAANNNNIKWDDATGGIGERTVNITITRKLLTVTSFTYDEAKQQVTSVNIDGALSPIPKTLPFKYYYTTIAGGALEDKYTRPKVAARYRVYAEFDESIVTGDYDLEMFYKNYRVEIGANSYSEMTVVGIPIPQDVTKTYTGKTISLLSESWYSDTYFGRNGYVDYVPPPVHAGEYDVLFSLKNSSLILWTDGSADDITVHISITRRLLDVKVTMNENDVPVASFSAISGNPQSGLVENETVPVKFMYKTARDEFVDPDNPWKRPSAKGDYRVYAVLDESAVTYMDYAIFNDGKNAYIDFHQDGVPEPQDITIDYIGAPYDLSNEDWYNAKYYGEGGIIVCPDMAAYIDCPAFRGYPYYTLTFRKVAEASLDWESGRTDSLISVNFYINPRQLTDITIQINIETNAVSISTGGLFPRDQGNGPIFSKVFTTCDRFTGEEIPGTESPSEPTKMGLYFVYPVINRIPDRAANYNYTIVDKAIRHPYSVRSEVVPSPTVTEPNKVYEGKPIKFELNSSTIALMSDEEPRIVEYVLTKELQKQGVTYNAEEHAFYVQNVGTYVIQFFLTSDEDFMWDTSGGYMSIVVEKAELTISDISGLNDDQFANTEFTVSVTHNAAPADYGSIAILFTYQKVGEAPVSLVMQPEVDTEAEVEEGEVVYKSKVSLEMNFNKIGTFSVTVGLAPSNTYATNKNYVLTEEKTGSLTVTAKFASVIADDLVWKYRNTILGTQTFTDSHEVEYNTREYTVFLDQDVLRSFGLKVKSYGNASFTKANISTLPQYSTSARLTAYDDSWICNDMTFEFRWSIKKGLYDLTSIRWDYVKPFSYTGKSQQVSLLNLYGGLKATLQNASGINVGNYTAGVTFDSGDPNFEAPTEGRPETYRFDGEGDFQWSQPWKIEKAIINPQWNMHGATDVNADGVTIYYPTLYLLPSDAVEYTFYQSVGGSKGAKITNGAQGLLLDNGREKMYYIEASIITGLAAEYENKYEISNETKRNPISFVVGENKTAVKIIYSDKRISYTGEAVKPEFEVQLVETNTNKRVPNPSSFEITFYRGNDIVGTNDNAPTTIGEYDIIFDLNTTAALDYFIQGTTAFTYTIVKATPDLSGLRWNYNPAEPFVFAMESDGAPKSHSVELIGLDTKAFNLVYTYDEDKNWCNESTEVGKYTATFDIVNLDLVNYETVSLRDIPEELRSCEWEIIPYVINIPTTNASFDFTGGGHDLWDEVGLPATYSRYMTTIMRHNEQIIYSPIATDAGDYKIECTLNPTLVEAGKIRWSEGSASATRTGRLTIVPRSVVVKGWSLRTGQAPVPVFTDNPELSLYSMEYYYDGERIGENEIRRHFGEKMTAVVVPSDSYKEGNVLVISTNESSISYDFYLFSTEARAVAKPRLAQDELLYNDRIQQFSVIGFDSNYMEYVGNATLQRKDLGTGSVTIRLKGYQNVKWDDGSVTDLRLNYTIVRGKITPSWDKIGAYTISAPEEYQDAIEYLYYDGETLISADSLQSGVQYTVIARITDKYQSFYMFDDDPANPFTTRTTFTYFVPGESTGDVAVEEVVELPVWQVILTGMCSVLLVIFAIMTMSYASSAKKAETQTKRLAESAVAAVPLLPILMATRAWLGMNENGWTILSLVLLGLTGAMLVLMLVYRRKSVLALDRLEAEKRRVDEERAAMEEERRRMEQQRRDDELRMMFAGLQSNYTTMTDNMQNMLAGNVQQMIAGAVTAMLPGAQQQQAALPPAPAPAPIEPAPAPEYGGLREVIARQEQMLNNLMANQQAQGYAGQSAEYDELRRMIEDVSAQQNLNNSAEYDELKRIIARQESMIDSMMDERKLYEMGSATDDSTDDKIPLVEAYGNLPENVKMLYYALGGFIMSLPEMVQIDGKYAVLFKYRNKSMFKLYIKYDAPYLCYMLENGTQAELRVEDDISLDDAKEIVTMRVKRVARETGRGNG